MPAAVCAARMRAALRRARLATLLMAVLPLAAACRGSQPPAQPTIAVTAPASSTPAGSPGASPAGSEPGIVAVTTAGALVTLDPATGSIRRTLVSGGVQGDEISVSPDGRTVYFSRGSGGCDRTVESVPVTGGSPTAIAPGVLPAVSPDGTKLAFAREPVLTPDCIPSSANFAGDFKLVIRTLSSGAEKVLPPPPQVARAGLPVPISHLSWASDSTRLAVSIAAIQDNEGWALYIVDTSAARHYALPGPGITSVPVIGRPNPTRSYIREGVFLPDGNLFIVRACCGGVPIRNTSKLMWEVAPGGARVHQVAIGYPSLDHASLAADRSGQWLLYLAGSDLYVSEGGNRPARLTSGLVAAAWI